MRARSARLVVTLGLATVLFPAVSACGSDGGNGPGDALLASWNATSFVVQGTDAIADGMSLVMTFESGGTYTLEFTNDQIGACSPGPDCIQTGTLDYTGTEFTFDAGTVDEVTLNYSIQGTTLTLTGSIEGIPVTVVLTRV